MPVTALNFRKLVFDGRYSVKKSSKEFHENTAKFLSPTLGYRQTDRWMDMATKLGVPFILRQYMCIVVVVLCVLLSYVYLLYCVGIAILL